MYRRYIKEKKNNIGYLYKICIDMVFYFEFKSVNKNLILKLKIFFD